MREDILNQIKNEIENKLLDNEKYNATVKRIKDLEKNRYVKEYINLLGLPISRQDFIIDDTDSIVSEIYSKYINKIGESDTNRIYVYLGTYRYSTTSDVVSLGDDRVSYDDNRADYRVYQDLEQRSSIVVNIKDCKSFEENNTILNPNSYFKNQEYYRMQKEFFIAAVKDGQDAAKKRILKKYPKL